MTELVVGKYKFYPYPKELKEPPPTLEELVELLGEVKAKGGKYVKTPSQSNARRRPRRNLHG